MSGRPGVADVPAVLYGVEEAAAALRLSRSVLYELIRSGQLRTVKQGRRRPVPGQFRGCRRPGCMPTCTRRCADVIIPPAAESQRAIRPSVIGDVEMEWSTARCPSKCGAVRPAERSTPSWRSRTERRGAASCLCKQRRMGSSLIEGGHVTARR
jgi:excisionase family DNA binding protein